MNRKMIRCAVLGAAVLGAVACFSDMTGQNKYGGDAVLVTVIFMAIAMLCIAPQEVPVLNGSFDSAEIAAIAAAGDDRLTSNMFNISFKGYWHKVWGMFLMKLFIFLWTLLFIIPGIVKSFSYAMPPFILEENPELSANDAIDRNDQDDNNRRRHNNRKLEGFQWLQS